MTEHGVTLTIDGDETELAVEPRTLLVSALRGAGHTAPKIGCESGTCGACTVHLDGDAVKSCTVLAVQADGASVTTVAGLDGPDESRASDGPADSRGSDGPGGADRSEDPRGDGGLHPVQRAFHEEHALQCGYCTPGMVMTAVDLLRDRPDPDRETIREELEGNVCRCTGYHNVVDAVERALADLAALDVDGDSGRIDGASSGGGD